MTAPAAPDQEGSAGIFPPAGGQNRPRAKALAKDDREYRWFCLEFCDVVLRRRPHHLDALASAAEHFTALGYFHDGLAMDERLATLLPEDPTVLYNLACSLALVGCRDEALHTLKSAVTHGYRDLDHLGGDADLESLHDDPRFGEILAAAARS